MKKQHEKKDDDDQAEKKVEDELYDEAQPLRHKNINGKKLYDKVLVDAQCTHDGSVKHLQKYRDDWGWKKLEENVLNEKNVIDTIELQKKLIVNGYRLLKNDGILVYSTCSLSVKQNENVVKYLLTMFEDAKLMDVTNDESLKGFEFVRGKLMDEKDEGTRFDTRKCVRFDPFTSKTSGLFIAKILKSDKNKGYSDK